MYSLIYTLLKIHKIQLFSRKNVSNLFILQLGDGKNESVTIKFEKEGEEGSSKRNDKKESSFAKITKHMNPISRFTK